MILVLHFLPRGATWRYQLRQASILARALEQVLLRVEDPRSRRRQRRARLFGDDVRRLAFDRPEQQCRAMRWTEARQRALGATNLLPEHGRFLRRVGTLGHVHDERRASAIVGGPMRAALRDVERDAEEKRRDLALTAKAGRRSQELEHRVLYQIVEVRAAADALREKAPHSGKLAPYDFVQVLDRLCHSVV
jgi:hypothetical protein